MIAPWPEKTLCYALRPRGRGPVNPMPLKILIVEDDANIRELTSSVLEAEGFEISAFGTAKEGIESFRASKPDLVLIDIILPDGTGFDVCREVKSGGRDIPVIIMTVRGELETRLKCFKLGAQDYVAKPFAVEELVERVKVHIQLKEFRDKLVEKNYELEMRRRARQDLTDMIVHDLKAPLSAILGGMKLIRTNKQLPKEHADNLVANSENAAQFGLLMLNDLLDISRAEQTGLKAESAPVDIPRLLTALKEFFAPRCQTKGGSLNTAIAADIKTVSTDYNLLFRVLTNILTNAFRVSNKGSEVGLECARSGGAVRFTVSDRGTGVPDSAKAKIFEKYTSETSQASIEDKGVGIGLTFCRMAVVALGGKIWVEDREGGGSLFILELGAGAES